MDRYVSCVKRSPAALLALLLAFCLSLSAFAANGFQYQHDPRENPAAMRDIVEDENAVYGFRPSETGSLKMYAGADWSDPDLVEQGRRDRIAYHESIESMYDMLRDMKEQGCGTEEIARAVSARRNEIRLEAYADDPEGLAALKARNLEKYGHEEGPLPDELYAQYGSWETVLEKAFSPNPGMDACLGLYDDYYFLYTALDEVPEDQTGPDGTQDAEDPGDVHHGSGLWGRFISFIHSVLSLFTRLFAPIRNTVC